MRGTLRVVNTALLALLSPYHCALGATEYVELVSATEQGQKQMQVTDQYRKTALSRGHSGNLVETDEWSLMYTPNGFSLYKRLHHLAIFLI